MVHSCLNETDLPIAPNYTVQDWFGLECRIPVACFVPLGVFFMLQAMDRCHRIGQTRPVLVLRLITAHSVEGKMIKRASEKMVLERLVMKKGAFKGDLVCSYNGIYG